MLTEDGLTAMLYEGPVRAAAILSAHCPDAARRQCEHGAEIVAVARIPPRHDPPALAVPVQDQHLRAGAGLGRPDRVDVPGRRAADREDVVAARPGVGA